MMHDCTECVHPVTTNAHIQLYFSFSSLQLVSSYKNMILFYYFSTFGNNKQWSIYWWFKGWIIWYASPCSWWALQLISYCMVQQKWGITLNDWISSYLGFCSQSKLQMSKRSRGSWAVSGLLWNLKFEVYTLAPSA